MDLVREQYTHTNKMGKNKRNENQTKQKSNLKLHPNKELKYARQSGEHLSGELVNRDERITSLNGIITFIDIRYYTVLMPIVFE